MAESRKSAGDSALRLLDAAEALLREGGLDAATVPAIAERAGMSVGNVYKRFADKDALLRAVLERISERAAAGNAYALDPRRWRASPLAPSLASLLRGTVRAYVANRRLYAAMLAFAEDHPDVPFRRRMDRLRRAALQDASRILLGHRDRMGHPDPERGVEFILTSVACTLRGVVLAPRPPRRYLADPDALADELTRMVLSYLRLPEADAQSPSPSSVSSEGSSSSGDQNSIRASSGSSRRAAAPARSAAT